MEYTPSTIHKISPEFSIATLSYTIYARRWASASRVVYTMQCATRTNLQFWTTPVVSETMFVHGSKVPNGEELLVPRYTTRSFRTLRLEKCKRRLVAISPSM